MVVKLVCRAKPQALALKEFDCDPQLKKDLLQNFQTQKLKTKNPEGSKVLGEERSMGGSHLVPSGFVVSALWSDAKRFSWNAVEQMADWSDWADGIQPLMEEMPKTHVLLRSIYSLLLFRTCFSETQIWGLVEKGNKTNRAAQHVAHM